MAKQVISVRAAVTAVTAMLRVEGGGGGGILESARRRKFGVCHCMFRVVLA